MITPLELSAPSENDYNVDQLNTAVAAPESTDQPVDPAVAVAIEKGVSAAVKQAPTPTPQPQAQTQPEQPAGVAPEQQMYQSPLLEVDALPIVASYLGATGVDVKPIGHNLYATMDSIQNLENLLGAHDSLAEASIYENQIRAEYGSLPPGYQPINPMAGGGGSLTTQHPTVLRPQPIGTVYEPKNTFSDAVQAISAQKLALMLGGSLAIVLSGVIVMLAVRGLETPAERELAKREAVIEKSSRAIVENNQKTTKDMKDISTKAMDKGNNTLCIGACDNQRPK